jgi:integrase
VTGPYYIAADTQRAPDRLTDAEVEAVLRIPDPYGFVARLALATGLRWGEVDPTRSTDTQDGVLVVQRTKSGRVRRVPVARGSLPSFGTGSGSWSRLPHPGSSTPG